MPKKRAAKRKSNSGRPTQRPKAAQGKRSPKGTRASQGKRSAKGKRHSGTESGPIRLQRLLASAGYGSRRQCEELIEAGRVEVDGQIVTRLGTTADPATAKVRVDGDLLKERKLVYYAVNKPIGVVTTNRDPQGRPRVVDLVPPDERVFPVGRLDRHSEGLILLTNDGELAQKLTHPKFGVRKVYRVTVAGKVDGETMKQMRHGIYLAEGQVRVEGAKLLKSRSRSTEMEIVLREGKNREIRRILARLGHKVQHLRRIAVGPLRLGDLPAGAYRVVKRQEVDKLWQVAETESESSESSDGGRPGVKKRGTKKRGSKKYSSKKYGSKKYGAKKDGSKKYGASQRGDASKGRPATKSAAKKRGRPSPKRDLGPAEITSNSTLGAVIGGEDTDAPATESRGRKSVKPKKARSKPAGKKSSSTRGSSRQSVSTKKSRGKHSGPGKRTRRKRN